MVSGCGPAEPPRQAGDKPEAGKTAAARKAPAAPTPPILPGIGRVVVDWKRSLTPPVRVVLGIGGVADGPIEGPVVPYLYPEEGLAASAHYLSRTYAGFQARLANGEMVFYGLGRARPGPVEQRMVVEWARRAAASLASGGGSRDVDDSYGLAFSWHRGASVGNCENVSVLLTGEAWAEACTWGGEAVTGRLQTAALSLVYDWFDTLGAFQESEAGAPGESEPARLVFAGQGARQPTRQEIAAIEGFASSLLRELASRHKGGAPVPLAPLAPNTTPAPPPVETSTLPAHLLLPQETGSPTLPPLARLAPAVPPTPPRPPAPAPSAGNPGAGGRGGGTSGRRSALSQPLR